jgi:hypothetical protein
LPVNLLLCEGAASSPDIRVLSSILQGSVGELRPNGGKYGFGDRILVWREVLQTDRVAGLTDGDFMDTWMRQDETPGQWVGSNDVLLGWRWRRKEIENYLIDPAVVSGALGAAAPEPGAYLEILEDAVSNLAIYEAARTALSLSRSRFKPLPNCWGNQRALDRHPLPQDLSDGACRAAIQTTVASQQIVNVDRVIERYEQLLPEFEITGRRRRDYLWTFAGKDLLITMDAGLRNLGFQSVRAFRERVILGIEKAGEASRGWIGEWAALATAVQEFQTA